MKTLIISFVATLLLIICSILFFPCFGDTNVPRGLQCSEADYSVNEDGFHTNLKTLMDSLAANVVSHDGFYQTQVGEKANKVYGLILCRGDIAADGCTNCTLDSIKVASEDCSRSKEAWIWFRWCFLRYSNSSFFGVMENTAAAITNDTDFEDPSVVSEGFSFMSGLSATAPDQIYMFQTAILNVSQGGKRYGMAQCTRDINRRDCERCLNAQLVNFRMTIGNKRRWEIYGSNCFMWYNDYRFYSNVSTLLSGESCDLLPNHH
ncbi:hypothetical protein L6164_036466 [Bauhinia variegata]|uniref:Uncharacterized protein n=1 Tax=Bauhinia variegata TaxID=167791 RepID=A0ACB9KHA1_BAUVA|nr:hypothetical protein L6164_036466 [Bauhinia variegata]